MELVQFSTGTQNFQRGSNLAGKQIFSVDHPVTLAGHRLSRAVTEEECVFTSMVQIYFCLL